jgi:hypothetical protein
MTQSSNARDRSTDRRTIRGPQTQRRRSGESLSSYRPGRRIPASRARFAITAVTPECDQAAQKNQSQDRGWGMWSQRRENASRRADVEAKLYFLHSTGRAVKEKSFATGVPPFDYAVVRILNGNILSGKIRRMPRRAAPRHLSALADWLRPGMDLLNEGLIKGSVSSLQGEALQNRG